MSRHAVPALVIAVSGLLATTVILAGGGPDPAAVPDAAEVAERTMSPFCPGLTLAECPTQKSSELRREVEARVAAGETNREIDDWLVSSYGQGVAGRPRTPAGRSPPAAAILAGGALLAWALRPGQRRREPEPEPVTGEDKVRLEEDLEAFAAENAE